MAGVSPFFAKKYMKNWALLSLRQHIIGIRIWKTVGHEHLWERTLRLSVGKTIEREPLRERTLRLNPWKRGNLRGRSQVAVIHDMIRRVATCVAKSNYQEAIITLGAQIRAWPKPTIVHLQLSAFAVYVWSWAWARVRVSLLCKIRVCGRCCLWTELFVYTCGSYHAQKGSKAFETSFLSNMRCIIRWG